MVQCRKCRKNKAIKSQKIKGDEYYNDNELCEKCLRSRKIDIGSGQGLGALFS